MPLRTASRHALMGAASLKHEQKVLRRDGTVEDLGVVAEWHANIFKHVWAAIKHRGHRITVKEPRSL